MADTREDLRFGAGRLDDDDLRFDAVIRERQVLRTDSVNGRLPIARARRTVEGELDTGFGDEARRSVERNPPLDEIHRRRADEPRHEQVGRMIVEIERCADLLDVAIMHADDLARTSVVWGKSVSVRLDLGGRRIIKQKRQKISTT